MRPHDAETRILIRAFWHVPRRYRAAAHHDVAARRSGPLRSLILYLKSRLAQLAGYLIGSVVRRRRSSNEI